ncbi:MAG: DUF4177 domain-containing protein [Spirochaetota bacterium]|nr:DUF4177 domain-containing protein [Thermodesulfobacteriota bacterium]MDY6970371.1 DUF4177 domain-containing protein [Spirochaetota bacterium]
MSWEYRQLQVKTDGLFTAKLPDSCFTELNTLAKDGWELKEIVRLSRALGRTDYITFVLKRESKNE